MEIDLDICCKEMMHQLVNVLMLMLGEYIFKTALIQDVDGNGNSPD